jgi:epoxyqueuosine reductase QueG
LAGLGSIGKSGLFLHRIYGSRVRLGTLFTDYPLDLDKPKEEIEDYCLKCDICVKACPASAISGRAFDPMNPDLKIIDPEKCSNHMKTAYKMIGRGAVCGICVSVCPHKNRIC